MPGSHPDVDTRVRALLKQCCQMCGPGYEQACERRSADPIVVIDLLGRLDPGPLDPRLQIRLTEAAARLLAPANRVQLLKDGADTFAAMLAFIEEAEGKMLLQNYIFRADAVATRPIETRART